MIDLYRRSIEVILGNQAPSGAFVACPTFPTYQYCWYRDASFCAYAMDLAGDHESAARFHTWASNSILSRAHIVRRAVDRSSTGQALTGSDILHTRYELNGKDSLGEEWPNFQLDGFGTWLWSLGEHLLITRQKPTSNWIEAADLISEYLQALWSLPCYDCWEEFPDKIHPYTLAAIYGGLTRHQEFSKADHRSTLKAIADTVHDNGTWGTPSTITGIPLSPNKFFTKFIGTNLVDGSLLALSTPYHFVEPTDPRMIATVEQIEQTIVKAVGVHRYTADTFYGGGEWVLLTGWLGWYYTEVENYSQANYLLHWMELQADPDGYLPEQVPVNMNKPEYYLPWVNRWGQIAKPLLWSHAMYIILKNKMC